MHFVRRSHSGNFPVARSLSSVLMLMLALFAATVTYAATLPAGFTATRIANGLDNPTAMSFAPDGRLFVAEQGGRLRIIKNGVLLAQPFVTISVNSSGERGLLGVAFDSQFSTQRLRLRVLHDVERADPQSHQPVSPRARAIPTWQRRVAKCKFSICPT